MTPVDRAATARRQLAEAAARLAGAQGDGAHFRAVFERSVEPMTIIAADGLVLEVNDAAARRAPAGVDTLVGLRLWELPGWSGSADARNSLRAAVAAAAQGSHVRYEAEIGAGDEVRAVDLSLNPVLDAAGNVALIIAEARDASARRRADAALRAAEERFTGIVSIAADAIITIDESQRITLFNRGAEKIFGYAAAEVLGQHLSMLLPERSRAVHDREVRDFGAAGESRLMGHRRPIFGRRKNGEVFPAEASISRMEVHGRVSMSAVLRDVTDRWAAEQERAQMLADTERARDAAERARERLAVLAEAGERLSASLDLEATFRAVSGVLVPRMAAMCLVDLVDDAGRVRRVHAIHGDPARAHLAERIARYPRYADRPYFPARAMATGTIDVLDVRSEDDLVAAAQDDEHLALLREIGGRHVACVPLVARGRTAGAVTLIRDVPDTPFTRDELALCHDLVRRAALAIDNARLYEAARQAIRHRERILSIVSHDLRNPLSAISMCAAALRTSSHESAEDREQLVRTITDSVEWMHRLIADLLDASSIEAGRLSLHPVPTDPVIVTMRAVHLFEHLASERGVRLAVDLPDSLPPASADEQRILQALANLIGNALKFTPAGGTVTVRAAMANGDVLFSVTDDGPGIPAANVPRIFDLFWTAPSGHATKGTGLGLAIAKGIIEAHGGRIWVDTAPGRGSAFHLALPLAEQGVAPPSAPRAATAGERVPPRRRPDARR